MKDERFAALSKEWEVEHIVDNNARRDNGTALVFVDDFSEIDWQATALELALTLKKEIEFSDESLGLANQRLGIIDGRDELIRQNKAIADQQSKLLDDAVRFRSQDATSSRKAEDKIESLHTVIEALGDRIHDIRQETDY